MSPEAILEAIKEHKINISYVSKRERWDTTIRNPVEWKEQWAWGKGATLEESIETCLQRLAARRP